MIEQGRAWGGGVLRKRKPRFCKGQIKILLYIPVGIAAYINYS